MTQGRTKMKPERAQELYSDYAEDTLTPALRQALEQHFEAEPTARADFDDFARIYARLEMPLGEEVEAPLGFRARILERVAAEQARREATFSQRAATTVTGWFSLAPRRRATVGALAALAAVSVLGVVFVHPAAPTSRLTTSNSSMGVGFSLPVGVDPPTIQRVDTQADGGKDYHLFHLHLPPAVPAATVSAYVVTGIEQVTDPSQLAEATLALQSRHLTNHQGVQIPIAALQAPPAGSTLNLLVQWTPDDGSSPGAEVVFTPYGAANPSVPVPASAGFLDTAQAIAAHYGATVIVDAASTPNAPVRADFSAPDAATPLKALAAGAAGYSVQTLPSNTFYVYQAK